MTPHKALGLAFLATLAASLVIATGTSSATVLCKIEMETCPESRPYPAKTKFTGSLVSGTVATLAAGSAVVKCAESTLSGVTSEEEAEPLPGEITALEFGECSLTVNGKSLPCSGLKSSHLPFSAEFTYSTEFQGHGTMLLGDGGKGAPAIALCETKCVYNIEPAFELGGEPTWASVDKTSAILEEEEICALPPFEGTFSATYAFSQPESGDLSVAKTVAQGTKLCKMEPPVVGGVRKCLAGQGYAGPAIEANQPAGSSSKFTLGNEKIECNETKLTGNFLENGAFAAMNGGIQTFTYKTNNGNCTSTLAGNPTVAVTMMNLKYDESEIAYYQRENPQAQLGFQGTNGVVKLRMVIGAVTCNYRRDALSAQISNGEEGGKSLMEISANWIIEALTAGCPVVLQQIPLSNLVKFEQGGGAALYVAKE